MIKIQDDMDTEMINLNKEIDETILSVKEKISRKEVTKIWDHF